MNRIRAADLFAEASEASEATEQATETSTEAEGTAAPDAAGDPAEGSGTLREKAAKGLAWTFVGNFGSRILSTAVMILLARLLTPAQFGLVALATVAVSVLSVMVDGGFAYALVQVPTMTREAYDTAFWTSAATGVAATLIAWFGAPVLADAFGEPGFTATLRGLSLTLLIAGFSSTAMAVLRREFAFKSLAMRLVAANLVGGAVGIVLALRGFGAGALVAQTVVKQLVQAVTMWWVCPVLPGFAVTRATFRHMFRFGVNVMGHQALNTLNRRSDDLLIGRNLGKTALGYYNIAYSLLLLLNQMIMQTVSNVVFSLFARLQHDAARMESAIYEVVRLAGLVTFPVYVAVIIVAPDLIPTVFGPQWGPSVPVMQVLATVGVPQTLWIFLASVLISSGKPQWNFRLNMIYTIMLVIGFFVVVDRGIVAVATSYAVVTYLFAPLQMTLVQRILPFRMGTYLAQFRTPTIAVAVMAAAMFATRLALLDVVGAPGRLLACGVVGPLVYLAVLLAVGRSELREVLGVARHIIPARVLAPMDRVLNALP